MNEDAAKIRTVHRWRKGEAAELDDALVVEEPLEIRVNDERFTVTMRTPGDDFLLAQGLLLTEGMVSSAREIAQIRYCDTGEASDTEIPNIVLVRLTCPPEGSRLWQRTLMAGSSCGLCGKAALEAVAMQASPLLDSRPITCANLLRLPPILRSRQPLFERTGGLHAVGLFTAQGECLCVYEDIGRHNATDKAIGHGVAAGWLPWQSEEPLILLVSGRASFEITQKALMARIPIVCAVSAASSLAAELATASNQTLVGFLRDSGFTVYAGRERLEE
jgi:FdhD protein